MPVSKEKAPRVAQSVRPNLLLCAWDAEEGIIGRNAVVLVAGTSVHVDAEDGAEEGSLVLSVAERVAPAPPSPRPTYR